MIFTRIKLMAIAGAASLAVGFGSGWITRDAFADAAENKRLETAVEQMIERENTFREEAQARAQADLESAQEQAEFRLQLNDSIRSLSNEIDDIAEVQSDLRLSAGYVRLLNDAITGEGRSSDLSDTSGASPYADSGTSDVDFDELARWQLDTVQQYKNVWQQCNALIEWNIENLVEPQEEQE